MHTTTGAPLTKLGFRCGTCCSYIAVLPTAQYVAGVLRKADHIPKLTPNKRRSSLILAWLPPLDSYQNMFGVVDGHYVSASRQGQT